MTRLRTGHLLPLLALAGALACIAIAAGPVSPGQATTSPKRCGLISHAGKRYLVKAHLLPCRRAKPWARRYLRAGSRPSGWSCRKFSPRQTSIRFLCRRGGEDFYAIRQ